MTLLSPVAYELQDIAPLEWFAEAIDRAAGRLVRTRKRSRPEDIVFAALEDAMTTLQLLPDERVGWARFLELPRLLEEDDARRVAIDAYVSMLNAALRGDIKVDASASQIRGLIGVRAHLPTGMARPNGPQTGPVKPAMRTLDDDWKILCFLARGNSPRRIAAEIFRGCPGMSATSLERRRDLHLGAMAECFSFLLPSAFCEDAVSDQ